MKNLVLWYFVRSPIFAHWSVVKHFLLFTTYLFLRSQSFCNLIYRSDNKDHYNLSINWLTYGKRIILDLKDMITSNMKNLNLYDIKVSIILDSNYISYMEVSTFNKRKCAICTHHWEYANICITMRMMIRIWEKKNANNLPNSDKLLCWSFTKI